MQYDIGLLILRLMLGVIFIGHGGQKMFGWFGGTGLKGQVGMVTRMGFRPTWFWALMAALSEFGGAVLVLLGFLSPLGSLGIIASMSIAISVQWAKGFWNTKGGYEYPLMLLITALALGILGPGAFSLDAALKLALPEPVTLIGGLILVALGVIAAFVSRAPQPAQAPQPGPQKP